MTTSRLLVAPASLAAEPESATLAAARAASQRRGANDVLIVGMLEGDLAGQHAVETELAREGLDREMIGRDAFVERVREAEARRRASLVAQLADAGVVLDAESGRIGTEEVVRACRVAFVRLFDAGLLERAERVVDVCPRCSTVVEHTDAVAVATEVIAYSIVVRGDDAPDVAVEVVELELLPGVVAVAVPPDHPAVGSTVRIPIGLDVPVLPDDATDAPWLVTPAHSAAGLDFARRHGLAPVPVLDRTGTVCADGPLAGLARFAARAAATDLATAEGAVRAEVGATVEQLRCGRCATTLVPLLGWHWFLRTNDLEVAAADALREGGFVLADVEARDRFVDRAERADSWCLSHQVWAGEAVPAARCLDCGGIAVTAEPAWSCNKCMGEMRPTDDVLDARFIAAVWPIGSLGWPGDDRGLTEAAAATTVVAGPDDVTAFALPVAALGLWLAGTVPFGELIVVRDASGTDPESDPV